MSKPTPSGALLAAVVLAAALALTGAASASSPPRTTPSSDPCATYFPHDACQNVAGKTVSLSGWRSNTQKIMCPTYWPYTKVNAYAVDTDTHAYTDPGIPLDPYEPPEFMAYSITMTNWSFHRHDFTPYLACI